MLLLIDNYDSFTYNLVHYLGELGAQTRVVRNDSITVQDAIAMAPDAIVLSPGPGTPSQAGICLSLTRAAVGAGVPVLGVCLGHQAIGEAFGGQVIRHGDIVHGKLGDIYHKGEGIFENLPSPLRATRYHSLVIDAARVPAELAVTATLADGTIMGLRHRDMPIEGVQFHPESIRTEHGHQLLKNFLARLERDVPA